ncbi:hypothetical protein KC340_g4963 [Hortaea werneckii]|nr:hypothetical protein KC342_g16874 [Hortaea werneckii]KAI7067490.1 hypothetical protein KC339_g15295 [Hortaea werneckii]KAI7208862.1 hypothetical protein KC365_g15904 [Hortaea werneckii]KAI7328727.1 hypothetical protein KC340_g4963 [Hortaea werneckii]
MSDFDGDERTLPFTEKNQNKKVTVLLIHGALSNNEEWNMVTPHLTNYPLLIPDLPGHGKASAIRPFSKHLAAKLIANTITQHAKDGKAHIIGISLGAYIAIDLAVRYPAVTLIDQAMDGTNVHSATSTNLSVSLCREVLYPISLADDSCWPDPWKARTMVVCAGKSDLLPTNDSEADTLHMRDIARTLNPETIAVVNPQIRHPWNRQKPELFAQAAKAWFGQEGIPDDFRQL